MNNLSIGAALLAAALGMSAVAGGESVYASGSQASRAGSATQVKAAPQGAAAPKSAVASQVTLPPDYVIGTDDVLIVMFRREKDMSAEVVVRPDGRITLPLLNDLQAAGLSTAQLREKVTEEAKRFVEDPSVTVIVKQINSRKVFITGQVNKPGPYPLGDRMTVMQLISMAGGLTEYAKKKNIVILRDAGGRPVTFRFNYEDIQNLKNLGSNIELRPGDTVIVP